MTTSTIYVHYYGWYNSDRGLNPSVTTQCLDYMTARRELSSLNTSSGERGLGSRRFLSPGMAKDRLRTLN